MAESTNSIHGAMNAQVAPPASLAFCIGEARLIILFGTAASAAAGHSGMPRNIRILGIALRTFVDDLHYSWTFLVHCFRILSRRKIIVE